jgi:excisionase family DNA binding protein
MSAFVQPLAYTVRECAEALRISERTVRRAIAAGKLQAIRVGRLVRVPAESLQRFVERAGQREESQT